MSFVDLAVTIAVLLGGGGHPRSHATVATRVIAAAALIMHELLLSVPHLVPATRVVTGN